MGSSLSYRWKRLQSMSADEMIDRARQRLTARVDFLRYKYAQNPVAPPQLIQPPQRPRFFFSPDAVPGLCALLRQRMPGQVKEIVARAEKICAHRFDLLGYEELDFGPQIDWHRDLVHGKVAPRKPWFNIRYLDFAQVGDSKITWELNRHQHLVTLAKAYRLTGNEKLATELFRQWRHWHAENPYPIGVNWASSLEVALRSLSWIWVYFLLADSPVMPASFEAEWLNTLHVSGRHLETYPSTYFSANTHLLGEALALFFIGTLCPQLASAERWKQRGWNVLVSESRRQVQADGVYFEQSIHYHVYALDMFLHAALLATVNNMPLPGELERTIQRMLDVLCLFGRAGTPPSLGDDDGGRLFDPRRNRAEHMLDPLSTGSLLFGRGDFKFVSGGLREEMAWLVGEAGVAEFDRLEEKPPLHNSVALQASGLYLMARDNGQQLVIDAGPQGAMTAGHGHADALSVSVNSGGKPLLVDSGTFEYVGESADRDLFRSTAAHNTLVVDESGQADPRGPFGWEKLPKVTAEGWISGQNFDLFVGSHDGYSRLANPLTHRRWVFSLKSGFWLVRDLAIGAGKHQLDLFWHVNPELSARGRASDTFLDRAGRNGLSILTAQGHGWSHDIHKEWWSPVYGRKERLNVLHFGTVASLPTEFVTLLMPVVEGSTAEGDLTVVEPANEEVVGYRYVASEEEHFMYFSKRHGSWSRGPWTTDAEFLYWGGRRESRLLICCNATYVEKSGKKIISGPRRMLRCEVVTAGKHSEIFSSEAEVVVDKEALRTQSAATEPALAPASSGSDGVRS